MKAFGKKQKKPAAKKTANPDIVVGDHVAPSKKDSIKKVVTIPFRSRRNFLITSLLTALVLLGVASLFLKNGNQESTEKPKVEAVTLCQDKSDNDLFQQSTSLIAANKLAQLKPYVEEIQRQKQYKSDPNCLYIVTVYYIGIGDAERAKEHTERLNVLNASVSKSLTNGGGRVEDIQTRTQTLYDSGQGNNNFIGVEDPSKQGGQQ
jgi:cell division protein FtsB